VPKDMADAMEPLVWSAAPGADQFLQTLNAWTAHFEKMPDGGENAGCAGTDAMRPSPRKIGVIHFDFDPPLLAPPKSDVPDTVAAIESYVLDFATMPQKATELMAKYKSEDITTIFFLGDPIMPQYLMA